MTNYEYGRQCFYKGNLNNPFRDGTYKHKEWLRGFNRGYFDNLEKVVANEHKKRRNQLHESVRWKQS